MSRPTTLTLLLSFCLNGFVLESLMTFIIANKISVKPTMWLNIKKVREQVIAIQLIIDSSLKIQIQQTHQNPLPHQEIPSHHQSGDSLPQKCLQHVNEHAYLPMATGVYVPKPVRVKSNYTQALQHQMPPLKHHCHKASPNDTESIFQLSVVHMARGCLMEPSGQFSHFHLVYFLVAVLFY